MRSDISDFLGQCFILGALRWGILGIEVHKAARVDKCCSRNFLNEDSASFHRYFQAGGSPENVIQLLSENYTAVAQTVNLLAEWLIQTGN